MKALLLRCFRDPSPRKMVAIFLFIVSGITGFAQVQSRYIVVDQFGYRPGSRKMAVIRDPQEGFDAAESFTPGDWYALVDAVSGEKVYRAQITQWKGGQTDPSSGDRAWHFDFSKFTGTGTYYVLDELRNACSFPFVIAENVYNEVLRQAMRTFFYQRAGFAKEEPFADPRWTDQASHSGDLQDNNCRSFFDKFNPDSERDVSGGWYDAGDYNKYTNWTANYVVELMKAYLEKPEAWGDDYGIPESGNGMPDILDEAIWGVDHLLRMQQPDGSVLSIVGEAHASPPSSAAGPSYYGPPSTSATVNTSAAFAIASRVYRGQGLEDYADTLLERALKAWEWAESYPDSLFYNNRGDLYTNLNDVGSAGLGAGQQETDAYGRMVAKLEAACYLFRETGETQFRDYFDAHYLECKLFVYNGFAYPYEALTQEVLLYYTTLPLATSSVKDQISSVYREAVENGGDNLAAYGTLKDPYLAHLSTYTWGSNGVKSSEGSMHYNLISYGLDNGINELASEAAEAYIHYIHGVNPLNFVYLSNMYEFGAENGVNEFYHSWFSDGSDLWDRVGVSTYGPAPGYLTGGPNPQYDWDGCCPDGCGSSGNNSRCYLEPISPPKDQPKQKSYKDFNTSWPLNSWEITENSCGYQVRYIRLLSKFVTAGMDCAGEADGGAFIDSCGVCAGGNTGIIPSLDPGNCGMGLGTGEGDTMYVEGRYLYSAAGEKVVLRGVNEMFVWTDDQDGERLLPEIEKTGANCVRLVWIDEEGEKSTLAQLISNCVDHHMIAIPECHSATGEWDKLDLVVQFWKDPDIRQSVHENRKWAVVNIGNEVGDGSVTPAQFATGYKRAIDSLRGWGYTVPLMIDASTWGQNVDIILATWQEILDHDPLHNILFSVHSYWSGTANYQRVANASVNDGIPLLIGEGPSPTRYPTCEMLDYATGLEVCGLNGIGWLPWSWGGVAGNHCVPDFDLAYDGVFGDWKTTHAADMMVDHPFSLMRTSLRPPSFFDNDTVPPGGIYFWPEQYSILAGDTLVPRVLVSPANAFDQRYLFEVSGDTAAVRLDPVSGRLTGIRGGTVQWTVRSMADPSVSFTREVRVDEVPVSAITITPGSADLEVGDTLAFTVSVFPEDATNKQVILELTGMDSILLLDTLTGTVVALRAGSVRVTARWAGGEVSGSLFITVSEPVAVAPKDLPHGVKVVAGPAGERLFLYGDRYTRYRLKILDMGGRTMIAGDYRGNATIDTSGLPPGVYLVINNDGSDTIRNKFIKF